MWCFIAICVQERVCMIVKMLERHHQAGRAVRGKVSVNLVCQLWPCLLALYIQVKWLWTQTHYYLKDRLALFPTPAQFSVACSTEKWERAWYNFSHEWGYGQGKYMQKWVTCKPRKSSPARTHWRTTTELKDGSTQRRFYVALHETVERTASFTNPRQWRHTATL